MPFSLSVTEWLQDVSGIIWGGIYPLLADAPISVSLQTGLEFVEAEAGSCLLTLPASL